MEEVFKKFAELYKQRNSRIPSINMGEDSVRYDFFLALSEIKNLKNYEIQLESPIDNRSYISRNNPRSQRGEKPVIDLTVTIKSLSLCAEFGLFRQNSNPKGNINKTARIGKMINDMLRLGLHSFYSEANAYFICVADKKILGHKLKSDVYHPFPAESYLINQNKIDELPESGRQKIDQRFINKQDELNISFEAKLVFFRNIETELNPLESKIFIWKIFTE